MVAGVFVTDPGAAFPPGAPAGAPEQISWHGLLHEVGFIVAVGSWGGGLLGVRAPFAALSVLCRRIRATDRLLTWGGLFAVPILVEDCAEPEV